MYAKSIAFDGNGRLTGARTVQTAHLMIDTPATFAAVHSDTTQYDTERPRV